MDYGDWDDEGFAPAGAMLGAPAHVAEDAHLESAYEERFEMGPEYEPYEPGPYTGDDPGDGCYDSPEEW